MSNLLAQSRVGDLARQFQHPQESSSWHIMLTIICVPLVIAGLVFIAYQWKNKPPAPYCKPTVMFADLCTLHALNLRDQRILLKLASIASLKQPALLFASPSLFDDALTGSKLNEKQQADAQAMKARLFS